MSSKVNTWKNDFTKLKSKEGIKNLKHFVFFTCHLIVITQLIRIYTALKSQKDFISIKLWIKKLKNFENYDDFSAEEYSLVGLDKDENGKLWGIGNVDS